MDVIWVSFFTPGWRDEAIRDPRTRHEAAERLAQRLDDEGTTAVALRPHASERAGRGSCLLELRMRSTGVDATTEAIAAVKDAADAVDLIVWSVRAYTDPQALAG